MDIHHAANRLREKRQKELNRRQEADDEDAGLDGLADLAQAALIKVKQDLSILSSSNTYKC